MIQFTPTPTTKFHHIAMYCAATVRQVRVPISMALNDSYLVTQHQASQNYMRSMNGR